MRQLSLKIEYFDRSSTCIGRVKEDNSTEVNIDITYWLEKFPNLTVEGVYSRPDGQNYPVVLNQGTNSVAWIVKRKDLYKCGTGKLTLNGYQGEQSVVSASGLVYILPGINGEMVDDNPDDPSTIPAEWIDDILKASAEAKEAARNASEAATLIQKYLGSKIEPNDYPNISTVLTIYELPSVGQTNLLYLVTKDDKLYYWSDKSLSYHELSGGGNLEGNIFELDGGDANGYN